MAGAGRGGGGSGGGYYGTHTAPTSTRHTAAGSVPVPCAARVLHQCHERHAGVHTACGTLPSSKISPQLASSLHGLRSCLYKGVILMQNQPVRADIAEFAAGPRSKADEEEGIVKYPSAAAPSDISSADGVVDYPAVAGAGDGPSEAERQQKDITGPDGLGDPSDWDPPPREIPHAGPRRGGAAAAAGAGGHAFAPTLCIDIAIVMPCEVLPHSSFCYSTPPLRMLLLVINGHIQGACSAKPF